jgi:hypothetical protein
MTRALRSSAASKATTITHRGRPPELAASLLVGELGPAAALVVASREMHGARMARSRLRFHFCANVSDAVDRQPYVAGPSERVSRTNCGALSPRAGEG